MPSLNGQKILIVGGATGTGQAIAKLAAAQGAHVVIASNKEEHLKAGVAAISHGAEYFVMDTSDDAATQAAFTKLGDIDGLVHTSEDVLRGQFTKIPVSQAHDNFEVKLWGQYRCAKYARVRQTGSITLFAGTLSRRYNAGVTPVTILNSTIEALGKCLSIDLSPVRVNVISPGTVATAIWDGTGKVTENKMFTIDQEITPARHVGNANDVASMVIAVMQCDDMTGAVIDVDGGEVILQGQDILTAIQVGNADQLLAARLAAREFVGAGRT